MPSLLPPSDPVPRSRAVAQASDLSAETTLNDRRAASSQGGHVRTPRTSAESAGNFPATLTDQDEEQDRGADAALHRLQSTLQTMIRSYEVSPSAILLTADDQQELRSSFSQTRMLVDKLHDQVRLGQTPDESLMKEFDEHAAHTSQCDARLLSGRHTTSADREQLEDCARELDTIISLEGTTTTAAQSTTGLEQRPASSRAGENGTVNSAAAEDPEQRRQNMDPLELAYRGHIGDVRIQQERLDELEDEYEHDLALRSAGIDGSTSEAVSSDTAFEAEYQAKFSAIERDYENAFDDACKAYDACIAAGLGVTRLHSDEVESLADGQADAGHTDTGAIDTSREDVTVNAVAEDVSESDSDQSTCSRFVALSIQTQQLRSLSNQAKEGGKENLTEEGRGDPAAEVTAERTIAMPQAKSHGKARERTQHTSKDLITQWIISAGHGNPPGTQADSQKSSSVQELATDKAETVSGTALGNAMPQSDQDQIRLESSSAGIDLKSSQELIDALPGEATEGETSLQIDDVDDKTISPARTTPGKTDGAQEPKTQMEVLRLLRERDHQSAPEKGSSHGSDSARLSDMSSEVSKFEESGRPAPSTITSLSSYSRLPGSGMQSSGRTSPQFDEVPQTQTSRTQSSGAAAQGGQPPWQNSSLLGEFVYVPSQDLIVTRDGRRFPRPQQIDRITLRAAAWERTLPSIYSTSRPTEHSYIHSVHRTQLDEKSSNTQAPRHASALPQVGNRIDELTAVTADMNLSARSPRSPRLSANGTPGRSYQHEGVTYVDTTNAQNRVRTIMTTAPAEHFTDTVFFKKGITAHRMIAGTDGDEELFFKNFRKHVSPDQYFSVGRVFLVLWAGTAGESYKVVSKREAGGSTVPYRPSVFSKVRRFVVIRAGVGYCSTLPILTYGGRGVAKLGVIKSEHAIIYTGKRSPEPNANEQPSSSAEAGLRPRSIRVLSDDSTETLDPMSRIDFGKVYTVQHNVKVRSLGFVHEKSLADLEFQFYNVWSKKLMAGPASARALQPNAPTNTVNDPKMAAVIKTLIDRGYTKERAIQIIEMKRQQDEGERLAKQDSKGKRRIEPGVEAAVQEEDDDDTESDDLEEDDEDDDDGEDSEEYETRS